MAFAGFGVARGRAPDYKPMDATAMAAPTLETDVHCREDDETKYDQGWGRGSCRLQVGPIVTLAPHCACLIELGRAWWRIRTRAREVLSTRARLWVSAHFCLWIGIIFLSTMGAGGVISV